MEPFLCPISSSSHVGAPGYKKKATKVKTTGAIFGHSAGMALVVKLAAKEYNITSVHM